MIDASIGRKSWPTVRQIAHYWSMNYIPGTQVTPVVDLLELDCFACGWYADPESWVGKGLERAHVVPRAAGGNNELSNFALLCKSCHLAAPDTIDTDWFWQWVRDHPRDGSPLMRAIAQAREIVAALSPAEIEALRPPLCDSSSNKEVVAALQRASKKLGATIHSGKLATSTIVRMYREVAREAAQGGEKVAAMPRQQTNA